MKIDFVRCDEPLVVSTSGEFVGQINAEKNGNTNVRGDETGCIPIPIEKY